jgi:hypothetical protein
MTAHEFQWCDSEFIVAIGRKNPARAEEAVFRLPFETRPDDFTACLHPLEVGRSSGQAESDHLEA